MEEEASEQVIAVREKSLVDQRCNWRIHYSIWAEIVGRWEFRRRVVATCRALVMWSGRHGGPLAVASPLFHVMVLKQGRWRFCTI